MKDLDGAEDQPRSRLISQLRAFRNFCTESAISRHQLHPHFCWEAETRMLLTVGLCRIFACSATVSYAHVYVSAGACLSHRLSIRLDFVDHLTRTRRPQRRGEGKLTVVGKNEKAPVVPGKRTPRPDEQLSIADAWSYACKRKVPLQFEVKPGAKPGSLAMEAPYSDVVGQGPLRRSGAGAGGADREVEVADEVRAAHTALHNSAGEGAGRAGAGR